jgi:hypothetical protein
MPTRTIGSRITEEWTVRETENPTAMLQGMNIPAHDHVSVTYTGNVITRATYKVGGVDGTVVCTVDLTYDGNFNPLTIAKS